MFLSGYSWGDFLTWLFGLLVPFEVTVYILFTYVLKKKKGGGDNIRAGDGGSDYDSNREIQELDKRFENIYESLSEFTIPDDIDEDVGNTANEEKMEPSSKEEIEEPVSQQVLDEANAANGFEDLLYDDDFTEDEIKNLEQQKPTLLANDAKDLDIFKDDDVGDNLQISSNLEKVNEENSNLSTFVKGRSKISSLASKLDGISTHTWKNEQAFYEDEKDESEEKTTNNENKETKISENDDDEAPVQEEED